MQVVQQNLAQVNLAARNPNNNNFKNGLKNDGNNKGSMNNFHNKNRRRRGRRGLYNKTKHKNFNQQSGGLVQYPVCNRFGHATIKCCHRFDHAY